MKMKNNNRGFTLLEVMVAVSMVGFALYALLSMLSFAAKQQVRLNAAIKSSEEVLAALKTETKTIPKYCATNSTCDCPKPAICAHTNTNGKTVQTCEGDCVFNESTKTWSKGPQVCNVAMICTGA